MKRLLISIVLASAMFSVGAMAQSAKFTASWEDDKIDLAEFEVVPGGDNTDVALATEIMSTIHVPNGKELLIGVSGVANVVTFTEAKGRNGGFESIAEAEGTLSLEVRVVPEDVNAGCGGLVPAGGAIAAPGDLTFASRKQTLKVTVDLDVIDDTANCGGTDQPVCIADTLDIEGDVTVALGLDTTAAHHFNFVAPDLGQGTYDVVACFSGDAAGFVTEEEVGDNKSRAFVAIIDRMITVQEVRAVQGDFIEVE